MVHMPFCDTRDKKKKAISCPTLPPSNLDRPKLVIAVKAQADFGSPPEDEESGVYWCDWCKNSLEGRSPSQAGAL